MGYRYEFRPRRYGNAFVKFNTEGEQKMQKIDWSKPIRGKGSGGRYEVATDVRVLRDRSGNYLTMVDNYGRSLNMFGEPSPKPAYENVPAEKFFLGLVRNPDGTYWLTDDGEVSDMGIMNYWKEAVANDPRPHWVVDTRKAAEPPEAVEYDPKDWAVVTVAGEQGTVSTDLLTQYRATKTAADHGGVIVRVRTTPPPADTARYIVLWREGSNRPWRVNKFSDGRQEFTWAEVGFRAYRPNDYCIVKVRD